MEDEDIIKEILNGDKEFTVVIDVQKSLIVYKLQTDEKEYIGTINGDDADFFKFLLRTFGTAIFYLNKKQQNNNAGSDEE